MEHGMFHSCSWGGPDNYFTQAAVAIGLCCLIYLFWLISEHGFMVGALRYDYNRLYNLILISMQSPEGSDLKIEKTSDFGLLVVDHLLNWQLKTSLIKDTNLNIVLPPSHPWQFAVRLGRIYDRTIRKPLTCALILVITMILAPILDLAFFDCTWSDVSILIPLNLILCFIAFWIYGVMRRFSNELFSKIYKLENAAGRGVSIQPPVI